MEELFKVLERGTQNKVFVANLLHHWANALEGYELTSAEKLDPLTWDLSG